jgi:hypothetical protein
MANSNGWGDGSVNNNIGWGQAPNNNISWGKSQITSYSGATDIDGGNTPVNTVAPAITGTAQEGQTLTCSTGTWSGSPSYTYQWKRNGSNIGSATNSTYTLVTADVGQSIKCTVTATNFIGSASADSNTVTPTSSTDADAQAFITAAGITNPTQQSAINTLVVNLKGYSIWTKFKAIYPIVGGTAATHKWNLKDPRDLDAAFRLTFASGYTHSSTGMLPNGTSAYANSFYKPTVNGSTNSMGASVYLRTNTAINAATFGSLDSNFWGLAFQPRVADGTTYYAANDRLIDGAASTISDTRGFFTVNRNSATSKKLFKNGSVISTTTIVNNSSSNFDLVFSARNYFGTIQSYDTKEIAFASIGDGLTDTEAANFYTAVQAFQTTLGRQV